MVMVPIDVGVQVRNLTETQLNPVRPISGLPSDLPDLQRGQIFRAQIQEVLPQNTYKALVAGKSLTLSLLAGAKTGDTLDLVAVDRTPGAIVAKLAESGAGKAVEAYQPATLSRTGQLIASLLARDGEPALPAALTRGRPLLAQAPTSAAGLAQGLPARLAEAVGSSGLFYEAHQVQWVHGQRQLASLLAEPQGEHSRAETLAAWRGIGMAEEFSAKSALVGRRENIAARSPVSLLQTLFGRESATGAAAAELPLPGNQTAISQLVPEDLRALVQQQLEAGATQRLVWHGEIWPDQDLNWEIEREAAQGENPENEAGTWSTNLRLTLPRLGEIDARLQLDGHAVSLTLNTADTRSLSDLNKATPALQRAFTAAGLKLLDIQTNNDTG
ncbi:MAG: flagellar hook-length control protein FliK [Burkholderiaceae bacterium]|nr:flagellar hook-length control protein FliK [Sulfuritalea sp.]MCF8176834.1 flagellar hook-length control protein FliK [Burkholderiaceae bacterium]